MYRPPSLPFAVNIASTSTVIDGEALNFVVSAAYPDIVIDMFPLPYDPSAFIDDVVMVSRGVVPSASYIVTVMVQFPPKPVTSPPVVNVAVEFNDAD